MDKYSLAFSLSNLGPKSFQNTVNKFGNAKKAWEGSKMAYYELGIKKKKYENFAKFRENFNIDNYVLKLAKEKAAYVSYFDKQYPQEFRKLENPPIGIFCKGNLSLLKSRIKIAVVGTRKITNYGSDITESIVSDLASSGVCIVSGLALGVDGLSHKVSLQNSGSTIAVMPCGVDCCLPSENYSIYREILINNGLIVSEYPLSQPPNKGTFLARNRLIAALSDGVLVTEAAEDSGSLVTADWGFKLKKQVFAVPGPINSQMAKGSLKLLKQGAKLVTEGEDVLKEFKIHKAKSKKDNQKFQGLSPEEKKVVELLDNEEMNIDEIARKLKLPVSQIFISISNLELKGIIRRNGSIFFLQN